jgi:hypothetical protein
MAGFAVQTASIARNSRSKAPRHPGENTPLRQRTAYLISVVELGVRRPKKVLAHNANFDRFSNPPSKPRVQSRVGGNRAVTSLAQAPNIIQSAIPIHVVRQIQKRSNLKLMLRRVSSQFHLMGIRARGIQSHTHMNCRVARADLPAVCHIPIGENLSAVSMGRSLIAKDQGKHQMWRRRLGCEERVCVICSD